MSCRSGLLDAFSCEWSFLLRRTGHWSYPISTKTQASPLEQVFHSFSSLRILTAAVVWKVWVLRPRARTSAMWRYLLQLPYGSSENRQLSAVGLNMRFSSSVRLLAGDLCLVYLPVRPDTRSICAVHTYSRIYSDIECLLTNSITCRYISSKSSDGQH